MSDGLAVEWKRVFLDTLWRHENANALRLAAEGGRRDSWTKAMTGVVVTTCGAMGWEASARNFRLESVPIPRSEYLALDVMAFVPSLQRWRFPVAVMELENRGDEDYIAYTLWKLLCVVAELRALFCYRRAADDGPPLIRRLTEDVINALSLAQRRDLSGETLVIVGSRAETVAFPYGYFKWWRLETNTGRFVLF
jgi:hypothetical protein